MIIRQRTGNDCGICCIAMLAGVSYETAMQAAGTDFVDGVAPQAVAPILKRLGFAAHDIETIPPEGVGLGDFKGILRGRRALVSVRSINEPGANHMLFWNQDRLIDPSPRVKQTNINAIKPHRIVLVG